MAKKKVFSIGRSLSDGLEQTIATAQNYSSDLRIDIIPLKKIETDPENPRLLAISLAEILTEISSDDPLYSTKLEEIESLQSLSQSIQNQGIINPILVYEHNGMYRLIAGERRTLASALAKKQDIQAKIIDGKPNELKIRVLQWIENIERSDLSLMERIDNLDKIVSAFAQQKNIPAKDVKITEISHLIGCAKSHAMNLKAVLNADDELKSMIACNKIKNLEKAALIANIQSHDLRKQAIQKCIDGATLKELKILIDGEKNPLKISKQLDIDITDIKLINFGSTTNIHVARVVLNSVLNNNELSNLTSDLSDIDFNNPYAVSQTFKVLVKKLEQIHE